MKQPNDLLTKFGLRLLPLQKPEEEVNNEQKGFYIAFDNSQPKRPKPPLRTKRSPKKERSSDVTDKSEQIHQLEQELNAVRPQGNRPCKIVSSSVLTCFCSFSYVQTANKRQDSFSFENESRTNHMFNRSGFESNDTNGGAEQPMARKHVSDSQMASLFDRRHLEDVTNHQQQQDQSQYQQQSQQNLGNRVHDTNKALIIDDTQLAKLDPVSESLSQLKHLNSF